MEAMAVGVPVVHHERGKSGRAGARIASTVGWFPSIDVPALIDAMLEARG
jgi:hypothetical protein